MSGGRVSKDSGSVLTIMSLMGLMSESIVAWVGARPRVSRREASRSTRRSVCALRRDLLMPRVVRVEVEDVWSLTCSGLLAGRWTGDKTVALALRRRAGATAGWTGDSGCGVAATSDSDLRRGAVIVN